MVSAWPSAVLGVQDERRLERGDDLRFRDLAKGHVEEIRGVAEVGAGAMAPSP
jgi:hypothetical protein